MTNFRESRLSRSQIARRLRTPLTEAPADVPFVATLAAMAAESADATVMAPSRRGVGLRLAAVAASVVVVTAGASYASTQLGGTPEPIAPVSDTQVSDDDEQDELEPMVVADQTEIEDDPKPEVDAKRRDNEEVVDEVEDDEDVDPLTQDTAPSVVTATGADTNGVDTTNDVSQDTATVESADDTADTENDADTGAEDADTGDDEDDD